MLRYILAVLLFLSPVLFIVGTFFYYDPYMLRGIRVNELTQFGNVALNSDILSTENYLLNREKEKYNTFVLGSSTAEAFLFEYWTPYLTGRVSPFMYTHKGGGGLQGIYEKVRFIDSKDDSLKNVLIILNRYSINGETLGEGEWGQLHDPRISIEPMQWKAFRSSLNNYLSKGTFLRYLAYQWTQKEASYMNQFLRSYKPFNVHNLNERIAGEEAEIQKDSLAFYTPTKVKRFAKRNATPTGFSKKGFNSEKIEYVENMKRIFDKHKTMYKVIIMPMYDRVQMNKEDVSTLQTILGKENVFDFSGDTLMSQTYFNYEDESHLRPRAAKTLIDRAFKK